MDLPKRKISSVEEFINTYPKVKKLIIDGTERPRRRPKDPELRRKHYSGKKKRHTLKNTLIVEPQRKKILILTPTVPGSVNDKKDPDRPESRENYAKKNINPYFGTTLLYCTAIFILVSSGEITTM